ncbi:tunicamycin resistance protein [Paenibacillus hubeiensis]|uniref:tunicamycin resistance protein n=1 Tax=Paenibacillus hubeiensis TaxID=3077330 RepID=UPI0031BAA808
MPKPMLKPDFQDHGVWRAMNVSMLQALSREFSGIIIVPMTMVHPPYFDEIIGSLRSRGIEVHHFALLASKETLLKRLRGRGDHQNSWPAQQVDRCLSSLSQILFRTHIHTDHLTPDDIALRIANDCGVERQVMRATPDFWPQYKSSHRRFINSPRFRNN